MPTRPVHEIRLGRIKATIWPVEGQNARPVEGQNARRFFNTTFARIYKDGATWKESTSFGRDDLPLLGKVADMVHTWIFTHGQEQNETQHQEPATAAHEEF